MVQQPRFLKWIILTLLVSLAFLNLFYCLGEASILSFDEARHGVSALEMLDSGNYLVNTYLGQTDYWNLKPPLAFTPMIAGFKFFGSTPIGLRFFSAFATLLTVCIVFYSSKKTGSFGSAVVAVAILLTTRMFFAHHNARSGDADAVFIFFFTAAVCLLLDNQPSLKQYCLACFLAALAFLTKSFHAGPLCLAICLFYFMDNGISLKSFLKGLIALFFFLFPILLWAIMRYQYDGSEFFIRMLGYDAVERLSVAVEGHTGEPFFTVSFILSDFKVWLQIVVIVFLLSLFPFRGKIAGLCSDKKRLFVKLLIATTLPILLYTISPTKLRWYAFCVYPLISLLLAYLVGECFKKITLRTLRGGAVFLVLTIGLCLAEVKTVETINSRINRFRDPVQKEMLIVASKHSDTIAFFLENGEWEQSHVLVGMFAGNVSLLGGNRAAYEVFTGKKALFVKGDIK